MANKIVREIIHAKGIDIGIYTKDFENEYISLTDIAKYRNDNEPRFVIQNWMRNRNTVEFLAVWEELHNPDFNRVQFEAVRSEAGLNRFVMTPTKWIEQTNAKDFYYYGCKHRNMTRGHKCDYKKQVHEEMLDASVAEVISKLISNPKFSDLIRNKINMEVDTSALDQEIENYKIQLRKLYHNKDTILSDMDSLDYEDKHYQRRKTDLENHLYKTYDKIDDAEELLVSAKAKKRSLLADKITGDNIYKALIFFDKLYAQMNEAEKREFLSQLVDNVQIYEERKENGQWLKSIEFKLPIIEKEFTLSLDNNAQNETVVLLSKGVVDSRKVKVDFSLEDIDLSEFKGKATYEQIKAYVLEQTGLKVSSLYIAQIKKKCGLDVGENFNLPKSENARQPQCTPEKEETIMQAFKHFGIV